MALKLALSFVGVWLLGAAIGWLPLPLPAPQAGSRARMLASAATTGVLLLVWSGVLVATVARTLAGSCPPASLFFTEDEFLDQGRWQVFGRRYRGSRAGRPAEIFFFPGQSVRRPLLVLEVAAHPRAVLGAGRASPLAGGVDGPALRSDDAELAGLTLVSPDAAAGKALLDDGAVRAIIAEICAESDRPGAREVALLADRVRVRWHPLSLDAPRVRTALDLAAQLAARAEAPEARR